MAQFNLDAYLKARPDVVAHTKHIGVDTDKGAREHFQKYGAYENTIQGEAYRNALAGLTAGQRNRGEIRGLSDIDEATRADLMNESFSKEYGGGMSAAELQDFETLVGRLEDSKMRQEAGRNRARQRETYGGGLASMMRNF
jgi:hypothetical protein